MMDPHRKHHNLHFPNVDHNLNNVLNNHANDEDITLESFATPFAYGMYSKIR